MHLTKRVTEHFSPPTSNWPLLLIPLAVVIGVLAASPAAWNFAKVFLLTVLQ